MKSLRINQKITKELNDEEMVKLSQLKSPTTTTQRLTRKIKMMAILSLNFKTVKKTILSTKPKPVSQNGAVMDVPKRHNKSDYIEIVNLCIRGSN